MKTAQRVWFITGVSGGLGRALAEEVVKTGDIVIGTLRDPQQVADFNKLHAGKAFAIKMDVNHPEEVQAAVTQIQAQHGRIDVLVNNAGYGLFGAIEETTMDEARAQMETNFFGVLSVTRAVLPVMRRQRSGHILQISSIAGFRSAPGIGIYNASKYALEGFSEALFQEVAPLNIKVTIIEPGPFRTDWAGSSSKRAAAIIPDYAGTAGERIAAIGGISGKQTGDPTKAAQVMIKVVNSENPPQRLPLGKIAIEGMRAKIDSVQKDIAAWEEVSVNTAFAQ